MVSNKTIVSPRRGIFGEERCGAEDCQGEVEFCCVVKLCCVVTGPTPTLIYREGERRGGGGQN